MANFPNCSLPKLVTGLVILFSVVSTTYSQRQIDPELEAKINDFIQNVYFPISNTSSLALAIVQGDDIFYTNGFGLSDIDKDIPTGNHTEFCIGSISKVSTKLNCNKLFYYKYFTFCFILELHCGSVDESITRKVSGFGGNCFGHTYQETCAATKFHTDRQVKIFSSESELLMVL